MEIFQRDLFMDIVVRRFFKNNQFKLPVFYLNLKQVLGYLKQIRFYCVLDMKIKLIWKCCISYFYHISR